MARRKKSSTDVVVDLLFAPVSIAVGVGKAISSASKAAAKEQARRERMAQQEINRQIREEKRRAADKAREERERVRKEKEMARKEKEAAKLQARKEAEQARLNAAYASLNDRYAYAKDRHHQLQEIINSTQDDMMRIEYCREDIALLPMLYDYTTRDAILKGVSPSYPIYGVYLSLSEAYERTGDFSRAIQACQDALEMNISQIGDVQMNQRIEKLRMEMKKRSEIDGEM